MRVSCGLYFALAFTSIGFAQDNSLPAGVELGKVVLSADEKGFPTITIPVINNGDDALLFQRVALDLKDFIPSYKFADAHTRLLVPVAYWHLNLDPEKKGERTLYYTKNPVLVGAKDAAVIQIRMSCSGTESKGFLPQECGTFIFELALVAQNNCEVSTGRLKISAGAP